jgi:oligopeptide transport system ATP-binding protein
MTDSASPLPHVSHSGTLLSVEDLFVHFPISTGGFFGGTRETVKAVDGVSFAVKHGETLGLVGESGCGKTTTGRAILRLAPVTSGNVVYDGTNLTALSQEAMRRQRRHIQMVFQDPFASLNPRHTITSIVGEPLRVHGLANGRELIVKVRELLALVGLSGNALGRYPHEFSGGQRQRIGIARALAAEPEFVVLDEPVSALDVSIQSQILLLLLDLQQRLGLTYLFIAHDLAVVGQMSDRVAVMYLGKIVELASREELYRQPLHPYTQSLLSAVPFPDPKIERDRRRVILSGEVPSPVNPPSGCRFHTRCPIASERCAVDVPELRKLGPDQMVACHFAEQSQELMAKAGFAESA